MPDTHHPTAPVCTTDPFADDVLLDPWPMYDEFRALGPAVWLPNYDMFALVRYDSVVAALRNDTVFVSSEGVAMNETMNGILRGNTLCSDGDLHAKLRRTVIKPVTPAALRLLKDEIDHEARIVVDRVIAKQTFCAVTELASHLPLTIVSNAVGLPEEGRERMMEWSVSIFDCIGPMNARAQAAMPMLGEIMEYIGTQAIPGKLKPGSWAEAIYAAADAGEVPREAVPGLMLDYMAPSLDTTIFGIASAVWLFARHPEQWDLVRADPSLIPNALAEVLRLEAPIQEFSRFVAEDYDMDGVTLPKGSRAIVYYGAANRDPDQFPDPDRFDVTRSNAIRNMAFGHGSHMCMGRNLANLEMESLFRVLAQRVRRFHVLEERRVLHNVLRGFDRLVVAVETD